MIRIILSLFGGEREIRIELELFPDSRQLIKHLTKSLIAGKVLNKSLVMSGIPIFGILI